MALHVRSRDFASRAQPLKSLTTRQSTARKAKNSGLFYDAPRDWMHNACLLKNDHLSSPAVETRGLRLSGSSSPTGGTACCVEIAICASGLHALGLFLPLTRMWD